MSYSRYNLSQNSRMIMLFIFLSTWFCCLTQTLHSAYSNTIQQKSDCCYPVTKSLQFQVTTAWILRSVSETSARFSFTFQCMLNKTENVRAILSQQSREQDSASLYSRTCHSLLLHDPDPVVIKQKSSVRILDSLNSK